MSFISEIDEEEDLSSIHSDENPTDPETSDEEFFVGGRHQCIRCLIADEKEEEMELERKILLSECSKLAVSCFIISKDLEC